MKKGILMLLALLLLTTTAALAQPTPSNDNFGLEAYIDVSPDYQTVLADQSVLFTAAVDLDQRGSDEAEFVSLSWSAQNVTNANNALPLTLSVLTSPEAGEDSGVFVSTVRLAPLSVPGVYVVRVAFTLTVDPRQGNLDRQEFTATEDFTLTVLGPGATLPPDEGDEGDGDGDGDGAYLNHGQIVSAWAHWKQTKEKDGFARGGKGVERSKVWYKTQVEYMEFASQEEVWEYLDSIYVPYEGGDDGNGNGRDKDGNGKDKDNNGNGKDKDNNGKDNKGN